MTTKFDVLADAWDAPLDIVDIVVDHAGGFVERVDDPNSEQMCLKTTKRYADNPVCFHMKLSDVCDFVAVDYAHDVVTCQERLGYVIFTVQKEHSIRIIWTAPERAMDQRVVFDVTYETDDRLYMHNTRVEIANMRTAYVVNSRNYFTLRFS